MTLVLQDIGRVVDGVTHLSQRYPRLELRRKSSSRRHLVFLR